MGLRRTPEPHSFLFTVYGPSAFHVEHHRCRMTVFHVKPR